MRTLLLALASLALAAAAPARDPGFDQTTHPAAPDYSRAAGWAVRGAGKGMADIFYIHPTTFQSRDVWNQDVADEAARQQTRLVAQERQLGAFAACCRRFMPFYRQATSRAFAEAKGDGPKAYALAYQDVRRAFREYLAKDNRGRPFIIAGHSQGGQGTLWLLRDEVAGKPIARQLVAAYAIGVPIAVSAVEPGLPGLHVCQTPTDTGCVTSWNTVQGDADTTAYLARVPGEVVCINPLSFDAARPAMPASANAGALVDGPTPVAGKFAARCDGGVLRVDAAADAPHVTPLPGGSLHMYDVELFWRNLSDNAAARVKAFTARR